MQLVQMNLEAGGGGSGGEKVFEIPAAAARLEIYLEICARSKLKRFETEMKKRFFFRKI